jgi:hypothetical protein
MRLPASALAVLVALACSSARADDGCQGLGTSLLVLTEAHELWLCEADAGSRWFKVSLGEAGVGKQRAGDSRTPLGTYPLGFPHASSDYYLSIPVGYPTPEQVGQGFTGKGIAIHGPLRRHRKRNGPQTKVDWTRGCIALSTDAAIASVVDWVREKHPRLVHIR